MPMTPIAILVKVSQASILLPVISGFISYTKLNKSFRVLFWFFVLAALFEIQASFIKMSMNTNMPGLHIFTALELLVLSYVYYSHTSNRVFRGLILVNTCIFLAVAVADASVLNSIWKHNTFSRPYASISVVVYTLIYFYTILNSDEAIYHSRYPMFWFSLGVLVYFSLNLFNFMLNNYLATITHASTLISLCTHSFLNIISNILLAQSFRCFRIRPTK